MHWDGDGWQTHSFPGSTRGDVAAVADDDVWFASGTADGTGVARHYDGTSWRTTQLPGAGPDSIANVEAHGSNDIWAVGTRDDQPYAAHWNGTRWRVLSPGAVTPPPGEDEFSAWLSDVGFVGDTAWAIGVATGDDSAQGMLYRFNGETWTRKKLPAMEVGVGASDVGTGPNGKLWLSSRDSNLMYRKTADGWAKVALPEQPGTATGIEASGTTGGRTWAVGTAELDDFEYHGVIYRGIAG
ncbi:MAG: hypothetical protein GEV07_25485 [Streptosporangiales bacterium]|nr:hypothetical protein [Streptosporangiales bacterium]